MRWLRLGPLRCKAPLSSLTREGETDESLARSRFRGQSSRAGAKNDLEVVICRIDHYRLI